MTSSLIDRLNAVSEQVALKRPVRVASTVNLTLSGFQTVDGVTPAASDENLRVLVKNQMVPSENGIYLMTTGSWERTDDFNGNRDVVKGTRVPVTEGNIGANKTYVVTSADPIVIDQSGIAFSEITESLVTSEFAKPREPVISLSSDTTLTAPAHAGKQIDVDCSAGDRVVTLPATATMTDGDRITIRYAAGTNQVIIACQDPNDAINGATSLALTSRYESLTLATDLSNWSVIGHTKPFAAGSVVFIKIVSRTLLTPPVSPTPGARYIVAASGIATGDWSSYANNDVIESNGQGGWIRYSPSESWHAYVEAENKLVFFTGTMWQGLPNTDDPGSSVLGTALFQDQRTDGTDGGSGTTGAWLARTLQTTISNTIPGCSLASNMITLPAGTFLVVGNASFYRTGDTQLRFKSTTTSTAVYSASTRIDTAASGDSLPIIGVLTLPASEAFRLEYFIEGAPSTSALGRSTAAITGVVEIYASVQIVNLAALIGPQGDQGEQGPQGFAGFKYQYSTTITQSDPGAGFVRLDNITLSSASAAVIDATSAETGNPDVSDEIARWGDTGGILRIGKVGAEQNWVTYSIISVTDNGGYLSLALSYRDHAGALSNSDSISLQFTPKGDTGANFAVYDYNYSNAVGGDPGSGKFLLNDTVWSPGTITALNISKSDRIPVNRAADIATWDDDGAASNRGYLYIANATNAARIGVFKVTGTLSDNGGYDTLPVSHIAGSAPGNNTRCALMFVPAGATGSLGGNIGGADNVIVRADGTGGGQVQGSPGTIDDSGKMTVNLSSTLATIGSAMKLSHLPSVAAASGVGVGIDFETKNSSSAAFTAAAIQAEARTVSGSSEDADLVFKVVSNGALAERMRLKDDGSIQLGSTAALALSSTGGKMLTGGFATSSTGLGTFSGSTLVPDPSKGQQQYLTNGGAFQINPMAVDSAVDVLVTNSSNAGTISFSSNFKVGTSGAGDTLTTATGSIALITVKRIAGVSTYFTTLLTTF